LGVEAAIGPALGAFAHAYTHFRVTVHAFDCSLIHGEPQTLDHSEIRWVEVGNLRDYPMGKVDRAIASLIVSGGRDRSP
jgi:A/G-specific adenine glycosylase